METKKIYFIDIIYYNCYTFYKRYEKDLNEFSGQILTSVCLSLNIIVLLILFQEFFKFSLFQNKWYSLFILIPITLFIAVRYNKFIGVEEIEESLFKLENHKRKRLNFIAGIYILISFFGAIVFFVVLGELNNPPPFWEGWF